MPTQRPVGEDQALKRFPDIEIYKQKSDDTQISLIKILSSEAEKFLWQNQYQDALFIYNQALALSVDPLETEQLIKNIEKVLEQTPAKDIKEFGEIQNIHIPRSLLLYWMGINYGMENRPILSKQALEDFLLQYPDHKYAPDARELVTIIGTTYFDKGTIGCLLPLTGKYEAFGQRALTGIQLAIQELSETYDKDFKLVVKDSKADPDVAARCVRQLHQENVAGIIGPWLTARQAGSEAQLLQIPIIALTQKDDFPLRGDYLFSNFITPQMQVDTLGNYLFGNLGVKKAAILYPDEKYGRKYMNLFWDVADEYGVSIVGVEAYDGKKTDFSDAIQKLTGEYYPLPDFLLPEETVEGGEDDSDPDMPGSSRSKEKEEKIEIDFEALFIPDSPSRVKLILPQLAFNDATGMYLVGTNLWHHDSLIKDAKGYNKHTVIADGFFNESRNPETEHFTGLYKSLFEKDPKFLEAIAYDTARLMFITMMDENVDSRAALKQALKADRVFEGATGTTSFDENGSARRELFLMTIRKGRFVEISR